MTQFHQSQVSLSDTPYYHCTSRCVRCAYLCGEDKYIEKSFEHRRQWVIERMHYLASLFNIENSGVLGEEQSLFRDACS